MTTHLVWFRRDLRLHDNLALAAACRDRSAQVLALYIATPEQWKTHDMARARRVYLRAVECVTNSAGRKRHPFTFLRSG